MKATLCALAIAVAAAGAGPARAEGPTIGPEIRITRAAGAITVVGDLSDPGWKGAARVDTWFETNPGDNVPPPVKNVAYLTYDDTYLYAGFELEDPRPDLIRATFVDRDN